MQTTQRSRTEPRAQVEALLHELEALRSDTKQRVGLAGMQLRDRWNHFELRHLQLRRAVSEARDESLPPLRAALVDLRASLEDLREDLSTDL